MTEPTGNVADLFSAQRKGTPLAERVRPERLDDVVGQDRLVGADGVLRQALEAGKIPSFILWGPPGTGKTTIARIIAEKSGFRFVPFSAVLTGIKEVREVMKEAEYAATHGGPRTVVFVDEIHRFNKAQQDAFLPFVERGDIVLIGATTENPSFEVIGALLSRLSVYVLDPLDEADRVRLLKRALETDAELSRASVEFETGALEHLASRVPGDARAALNLLETAVALAGKSRKVDKSVIDRARQKMVLLYDKGGEEHYNIISALHKSLRNSDPHAALYWLARMLEAGEDPLYIVRRLIRFASEDVGNADPAALSLAVAAKDTVHFIGLPEGKLALAQLTEYLACAPKSNATYRAYGRVERDLGDGHVYPVPLHLRNAPTKLMKDLDYGEGYEYAHDRPELTTGMECLPAELAGRRYYEPVEAGFEREIRKRMEYFERLRARLRDSG